MSVCSVEMSAHHPALPIASYDPPSWAGKASSGLHLDVLKVVISPWYTTMPADRQLNFCCQDAKLIQKLMIDEKKCYLFGRNPQMTDFVVDHGSCSR